MQSSQQPNFIPVMSAETFQLIAAYCDKINKKLVKPGVRLYEVLRDSDYSQLTPIELIDALFRTIPPTGYLNGWTSHEEMLLKRITRIVEDVTVYSRRTFYPEQTDFFDSDFPKTTMMFINTPLLSELRSSSDFILSALTEKFYEQGYERYLEQYLLPSLQFASQDARENGAVVTMPILGSAEIISKNFDKAIIKFIKKHSALLPNLKALVITVPALAEEGIIHQNYVDGICVIATNAAVGLYPHSLAEEFNQNKIKIYTCLPSWNGHNFPARLYGTRPFFYSEEDRICELTNVKTRLTGVEGEFNREQMQYLPKSESWLGGCKKNKTILSFDKIRVYDEKGEYWEDKVKENTHYKPCRLHIKHNKAITARDEYIKQHIKKPIKDFFRKYLINPINEFGKQYPWIQAFLRGNIIGLSIGAGFLIFIFILIAACGGLATAAVGLLIIPALAGVGIGLAIGTDIGLADILNHVERFFTGNTDKKIPGFFQKNPWVVDLIKGALIGVIIVGTIVAIAASCGAAAPVLGITLGGLAGLFGSTGIFIGAGAAIIAGFSAISVFFGEVCRRLSSNPDDEKYVIEPVKKLDQSDNDLALEDKTKGIRIEFPSIQSIEDRNERITEASTNLLGRIETLEGKKNDSRGDINFINEVNAGVHQQQNSSSFIPDGNNIRYEII